MTRKKSEDFFDAYQFLSNHRIFQNGTGDSFFNVACDMEVVKVNPKTLEVDNETVKNTLVRVWLECGPLEYNVHIPGISARHDSRLDCGGGNFEEAIIKLAKLVREYYGV